MKSLLATLTAMLAFAAIVDAAPPDSKKKEETKMLKAVVHINFADLDRQEDALGNIENILKSVPTAEIAVVCHGKGINLLVKKDSKHSEKVVALLAQGVRFVACENTMKKKEIEKDSLVGKVKTVPSGAIEILRKQQEGYGYFKP